MKGHHENWVKQVRKGLVELCLLNVIASGRRYGYQIVELMQDTELGLPAGTIYPVLSRLRKEGLVVAEIEESPSGPPRKYYRISPLGQAQRGRMNRTWNALKQAVDATAED